MNLLWNRVQKQADELESLKARLEEYRDRKESYRERYESEKERRSKLSRKKQELDSKVKKLQEELEEQKEQLEEQKKEEKESQDSEQSGPEKTFESVEKSLKQVKNVLDKLESFSSSEIDCVTVYRTREGLGDEKGLKNSLSAEQYRFVREREGVFFIEPEFIQLRVSTRDFFEPEWELGGKFETEKLRQFIEEKKRWAVVSAGETKILKEKSGEIIDREDVKTRVDSKQKKGGFSQGRFENKREEQIQEHLKEVEEEITENTLLVGDKRLCKQLPGEYLGGFDDSMNLVDALYSFRVEQMKQA